MTTSISVHRYLTSTLKRGLLDYKAGMRNHRRTKVMTDLGPHRRDKNQAITFETVVALVGSWGRFMFNPI